MGNKFILKKNYISIYTEAETNMICYTLFHKWFVTILTKKLNITAKIYLRLLSGIVYLSDPPFDIKVASKSPGALKLTWSHPKRNDLCVHKYKITWLIEKLDESGTIFVDADKRTCIIPHIIPSKLYQFTVTSCLQNSLEGNPSDIFPFDSGGKFIKNPIIIITKMHTYATLTMIITFDR